ncbi:uncharacterized protein LOC144635649 [Oculina patagonica]
MNFFTNPYRILPIIVCSYILSLLWCRFTKLKITAQTGHFTQEKQFGIIPGSDLLDIDFYVHPNDSSVVGVKFHMDEEARNLAKELIQELEDSFKKNPVNTTSIASLPKIALATGASSNHFDELLAHIDKVPVVFPNRTLIVYDLGLNETEIKTLREINFVEYRKFNFTRYPKHVKDLHTYAWKPLILQQLLCQYGGAMWMDSSIVLTRNITYLLQRMVRLQTGFLFYLPGAGHSIASATHPQMLQYLPMADLEVMTEEMNQGGGTIVLNTPQVRRDIFRWALVCALHRECITPSGSKLYCDFKFPKDQFGGCHRYDQAMLSIIVANANNYKKEMYLLKKNEYPCEIQKM